MADQDPGSYSFEVTVLKNKSGTDAAQVPAGATVKILELGAVVKTGVTVPTTGNDPDPVPTSVAVFDSLTLQPQDLLDVNAAASNKLIVAAPPPGRHSRSRSQRHGRADHARAR